MYISFRFISFRPYRRYNSKLTLLALPSVIYEPRFRGSIRNLVYADQPNVPARRQEMRQPRDIKVSIDLFAVFYYPSGWMCDTNRVAVYVYIDFVLPEHWVADIGS